MSYYRKKPVIIEARQYVGTASQTHDVYLWVEENTLGSFEPLDVITGRVPCPASGVSIDPRDGAEAPPLERDRVAVSYTHLDVQADRPRSDDGEIRQSEGPPPQHRLG